MQRRLDLLVSWGLVLVMGLLSGIWVVAVPAGAAIALLWPGFRDDLRTQQAIDNMAELCSAARREEELLLRLLQQVGGASGPVVARVTVLHIR